MADFIVRNAQLLDLDDVEKRAIVRSLDLALARLPFRIRVLRGHDHQGQISVGPACGNEPGAGWHSRYLIGEGAVERRLGPEPFQNLSDSTGHPIQR